MAEFNPDIIGKQAEVEINDHRFPCHQCGSDMRFAPESGLLACDHCGATRQIGASEGFWNGAELAEIPIQEGLDNELAPAEMEDIRTSQCPNCGATVEFQPDIHSKDCPFCATPVVVDTGTHRQIKPKGVLPFGIPEKEAHERLNNWLGSLWFAPNGLKEYARKGRKMNGIYVPYWTYDAATRSRYRGQRGDVYYETQRVTVMVDGKPQTRMQQVPKIRWTPVSGRVARNFDDVLVLGATSLPKKYTDALQPWDLPALEPYRPEYLAGFRAEAYTVALKDGFTEARQIMDRTIRRDVKFDIGGDQQQISALDTDISNVTFKHILLPVWMAAYKYRGQSYRFVINGRTGQVEGERPYSKWKIAFAVILGLIVAAIVGFVLAGMEGGSINIGGGGIYVN
ncbi:primosomal protein N' (replication factor Y) - superfamily II helicase [Paracoccaceae bacterium GXU_MW_L88]